MNSDQFKNGLSFGFPKVPCVAASLAPEYQLKLYPLDEEYCGTITIEMDIKTQHTSSLFNTIIIFDRSGSMGDSVERFINKVFPLLFSHLKYELSSKIHLITFDSGVNYYDTKVESFKNLMISSGDQTFMAPAVAELQKLFRSLKNISQNKAVRLLTISDGLVHDPTQVKSEAQKLVEFLSRESFKINSQAVRFIIDQSQPDTTAIASLLQLNNTTKTNLIDVHDSESDDIIATKISNLFASDSFEKIVEQKTLSAEFDILFNFPGDLTSTSKITLLPGKNTLWLKEFPAKGIKINESPVVIDQQPPLTLVTFQALMENEMGRFVDHIRILKIEGSSEAYDSVNKMINYFEKKEVALGKKTVSLSVGLDPKKITRKLKTVAGDDVSKLNNDQRAEYLRQAENEKTSGVQGMDAVLASISALEERFNQQFQDIRSELVAIKSTVAAFAVPKEPIDQKNQNPYLFEGNFQATMFGGQKNTFGEQPAPSAFSSFNLPKQNANFGLSAFDKPATGFGNIFGQNTSVFGAQPAPRTFLFGATSTPQKQQGFEMLGQQQQKQKPTKQTSIFGSTKTAGSTSFFGAQQPTAFGAAKPEFGFGQLQQQQPSTFLFSSNPAQPQQSSLFGPAEATNTTAGGLFGSPATPLFGKPSAPQLSGTRIAKFQAPQETDTQIKGSTQSYVQTKQQCITFMKEYAEKSLEELRIEDNGASREGPQAPPSWGSG